MLNFHGTHGTCKRHAKSINKTGFKDGSGGLRGRGVYFWFYDTIDYEARMLAINWVDTANKWNHFGDSNPEKAVIIALLCVEEDNFLDLNEPKMSELFNTYISTAASAMMTSDIPDGKEKRRLMSNVYDWAVSKIEKKFQQNFALLLTRVQAPDKNFYAQLGDMKLYPQPLCLVVKSLDKVKVEIKDILHI